LWNKHSRRVRRKRIKQFESKLFHNIIKKDISWNDEVKLNMSVLINIKINIIHLDLNINLDYIVYYAKVI
jgi:hypothetical protein